MVASVVVLGHACELSETNAYGWVPVCSCGWIGSVHPTSRKPGKAGRPSKVQTELARAAAQDEHELHVRDIDAQLQREHRRALDDHGKRIALANEVLQRRGRWGSG
jgi:hypothetical protein